MQTILFIIVAYLIGSIPWGYIISKAKGVDIRTVGSGNIGGTNVSRKLGVKLGILVTLLDLLKGFLSVYIASQFFSSEWILIFVGLAVILGHIFPIFLNFKGGKGVATTGGVMLAIAGWQFILVLIFIWAILLFSTRLMSLSNLILSFIPILYFFFILHSNIYAVFSLFLIIIIFWTHRENIKRLREGKELKLTFKK